MSEFDISISATLGFKIDRCKNCRRARSLEHYYRHRDDERDTPPALRCTRCGSWKRSEEFPRDGRYTAGVMPECYACRDG